MKLNKLAGVIGFTAATLFSVSALAAGVDKDLPDYTPTSGISATCPLSARTPWPT